MNEIFGLKLNNVRALQLFQLFRFGVLLLTGMLFAKAGLATEQIGVYEKLILFSSALSFFWISGFIQSLLSSHENIEAGKKSKKLFTVFVLLCLCSVAAFFIFRFLIPEFYQAPHNSSFKEYVNLFSWYLLFANPAFLIEYIYLLKSKPKNILFYGFLIFSVQLLLTVIPAFMGWNFSFILWGLLASAVIKFHWLLVLIFQNSEIKFDKTFASVYVKLALPLIASAILSGSIEYIDGFIVTSFFDEATFAVFRYGAKELPLVLLLAGVFSNAMLPKFREANNLNEPLAELKKSSLRLMHWLFPLSIILMLTSKFLYPFFFNESFSASAGIFNIYLLLIISRLVFPQTILIGLKENKFILIAALAEAFINIVFSIVLIRFAGVEGVAWGVFIACTSEKILLALFVKYKLKISFQHYVSSSWLLFYSLAIILAWVVASFVL